MNTNIFLPFIISFFAGLSTLVGGLFIFFPIKGSDTYKFLSFSLAFSIGVMITISIFDILPSSIIYIINNYGISGFLIILLIIILGLILFNILSFKINSKEESNKLYNLGVLSMISLIIHNVPEGIITFLSSVQNIKLGIKMAIIIALHNIPEGIAIAVPIYYGTKRKGRAIGLTFISGISEFMGAIIAYLFLYKYLSDTIINVTMIFVGIIMITLAIEEIFPECIKYHKKRELYLGLFIGMIISLLSIFL